MQNMDENSISIKRFGFLLLGFWGHDLDHYRHTTSCLRLHEAALHKLEHGMTLNIIWLMTADCRALVTRILVTYKSWLIIHVQYWLQDKPSHLSELHLVKAPLSKQDFQSPDTVEIEILENSYSNKIFRSRKVCMNMFTCSLDQNEESDR